MKTRLNSKMLPAALATALVVIQPLYLTQALAAIPSSSCDYGVLTDSRIHCQASSASTSGTLTDLEGKDVHGKYNEYLGYVLAVDLNKGLAQLQTPTGVAVALSTDLLIDMGNRVRAPFTTRGDVLALIRKPGERPFLNA